MPIGKQTRYIGVVFVMPVTGRKKENVLEESLRCKGLVTRSRKNVNYAVLEHNSSPN